MSDAQPAKQYMKVTCRIPQLVNEAVEGDYRTTVTVGGARDKVAFVFEDGELRGQVKAEFAARLASIPGYEVEGFPVAGPVESAAVRDWIAAADAEAKRKEGMNSPDTVQAMLARMQNMNADNQSALMAGMAQIFAPLLQAIVPQASGQAPLPAAPEAPIAPAPEPVAFADVQAGKPDREVIESFLVEFGQAEPAESENLQKLYSQAAKLTQADPAAATKLRAILTA